MSAGTEFWGGRDREPFHGKRELFESDHQDRIEVESIYAPCSVLRLFEYEEKVGWEVDEHGQRQRWKYNEDKELVFFYRFEYLSDHSVFKSNIRVPLYCRCRQPYNPDERQDMTQCASCREVRPPARRAAGAPGRGASRRTDDRAAHMTVVPPRMSLRAREDGRRGEGGGRGPPVRVR